MLGLREFRHARDWLERGEIEVIESQPKLHTIREENRVPKLFSSIRTHQLDFVVLPLEIRDTGPLEAFDEYRLPRSGTDRYWRASNSLGGVSSSRTIQNESKQPSTRSDAFQPVMLVPNSEPLSDPESPFPREE